MAPPRLFSEPGRDPLDAVEWIRRRAEIVGEDGTSVFRADGVEVPADWSESAVNVVCSRYLYRGREGNGPESSARQLFGRVAGVLADWVREAGLGDDAFRDELLGLLVQRRGAFNSPVWFNVGIEETPQCSACFILSVEDTMESILELARVEAWIFKRGSGAGCNLSPLRSSEERISTGGFASGPVSFMRAYDALAGVIKSGGRTRRAAKMQVLDCDHPDVLAFARAKMEEERKARALIAGGFDAGINGEAYRSVAFQNANLSIRVTDAFMEAAKRDDSWPTRRRTDGEPSGAVRARDVLRTAAEGAWSCGDPGLQFQDTIERWNPCRKTGPITASNPCSEYLFLDDTACNLASLNLLTFLAADGAFDLRRFRGATSLLIRAMEAVVDRSSYPTEGIAAKSHRFRPLGLGYANLGASLMQLGLAYDSDEARGWAAAITALLSGEAYLTSAAMAERVGPFPGFEENREPTLDVLRLHREAVDGIAHGPEALVGEARRVWDEVVRRAETTGVRNAQATVLAPTGTISFLMDCDTTGIEPDIALVKVKRLAGGGTLNLVNRSVGPALQTLGYGPDEVEAILRHLDREQTMEGAPGLRADHLPVFDCSFRAPNGARSIRPEGHLRMMAAVQPFLSGGISKTVNLPEDADIDTIAELMTSSWQMGLKAVAFYRENAKSAQPLAVKSTPGVCAVGAPAPDCFHCGNRMVPSGSCFRCLECGEVSSCS